MFANRFVVVIDACSLVGALTRNTLLSLAYAGLYRARWSEKILDETEIALSKMFKTKGHPSPDALASEQRQRISRSFEEAQVENYECHIPNLSALPDPNDAHVVAAAITCGASLIVTENLKDFPTDQLIVHGIEVKNADEFIADTIDLYPADSVNAISTMRKRLNNPSIDPRNLILRYESNKLLETASILQQHQHQL